MTSVSLTDLCLALAWGDAAVIPITLASVAIAVVIFWWWRRRQPVALPQAVPEEPAPVEAPGGKVEEADTPPNEGPGQLLVRLQTLNKDFEQATRDLQRYNGSREVQLQGWQQLSSDIIRRILPVLDNLEPYLNDSDSAAADVARLAYGRLLTELVTIGVTQIIPTLGQPFNGKYHLLGPDSTGYPPYRIKTVVSPGYRFQPRVSGATEIVLKPAEVIVESDIVVEGDDDVTELERMPPSLTEKV